MSESKRRRKPYDPAFGDDRLCTCGHTYYRHFDPYEDMEPVGCKYCSFSTPDEVKYARSQSNDPEAEWWDEVTCCAGFVPADGIETPDPHYQDFSKFIEHIQCEAAAFFSDHPEVAQLVAHDGAWQIDAMRSWPMDAIREAAAKACPDQ
jgi:hypothetical protein